MRSSYRGTDFQRSRKDKVLGRAIGEKLKETQKPKQPQAGRSPLRAAAGRRLRKWTTRLHPNQWHQTAARERGRDTGQDVRDSAGARQLGASAPARRLPTGDVGTPVPDSGVLGGEGDRGGDGRCGNKRDGDTVSATGCPRSRWTLAGGSDHTGHVATQARLDREAQVLLPEGQ